MEIHYYANLDGVGTLRMAWMTTCQISSYVNSVFDVAGRSAIIVLAAKNRTGEDSSGFDSMDAWNFSEA